MILKARTLYCLKVQLRLASLLKVIPYEINPSTGNLQIFPGILARFLWRLVVVVNCSYVFFLYVRFYQMMKFNEFADINKTHFAILLSWCIGYAILIAGHIAVCSQKDEILEFINRFHAYLTKMEAELCTDESNAKKTGLSEYLIQGLPFIPMFSVWANFFTTLFFPSCPSFIISLFSREVQNCWCTLIPYALVEYMMAMCIWKNAAFLASHLIAYLKANAVILESMRAKKTNFHGDWDDFKLYRAIQVLNNSFNSSFAPLVMTGGTFTFVATEVLYGVACFKMYRIVPMAVYPIFPVVKFVTGGVQFSILKMAGACYVQNLEILADWKKRYIEPSKRDLIARAFLQSFSPVKVCIGRITSVNKSSVVLYMNMAFQLTINLLLALQFE